VSQEPVKQDPKSLEPVELSPAQKAQADAQNRAQKCGQEIQAALQKWGCRMELFNVLRPGQLPEPKMTIVTGQ
jgi:hypothetical protein